MKKQPTLSIQDYPFTSNDFIHYFKNLYKDRGLKSFYQFLNRPLRRQYSRKLISTYSPQGNGLEIGVGARTIAPTNRTVLSDAYSEHGIDKTIAKVFFKGGEIPYDSESFDFILSEHVLEHIANPIKTLKEWLRILKPGGIIYLFLPHHHRTNDQFRAITTLKHLIEDYEKNIPYDDPSHFKDWWENVVEKDLMPEHYKHIKRDDLLSSASIHHHTWTEKEISELLSYLGLNIIKEVTCVYDRRDSFVIVAQKQKA